MNETAARFRNAVAHLIGDRPLPTPRELEVARLAVVDGLTQREIAARLGIASATAKAHLAHFAARVGLPLRACRHEVARVFWSSADRVRRTD